MEINKRIKNLRLAKKITQEEIATYLGIKISSYSQLERKGVFSAERLALIADYFNVDYNYLLVGKEPDPKHLDTNDILFICDCIHKEFEKNPVFETGNKLVNLNYQLGDINELLGYVEEARNCFMNSANIGTAILRQNNNLGNNSVKKIEKIIDFSKKRLSLLK